MVPFHLHTAKDKYLMERFFFTFFVLFKRTQILSQLPQETRICAILTLYLLEKIPTYTQPNFQHIPCVDNDDTTSFPKFLCKDVCVQILYQSTTTSTIVTIQGMGIGLSRLYLVPELKDPECDISDSLNHFEKKILHLTNPEFDSRLIWP